MVMTPFAPQTREIDMLLGFFRRLKTAESTRDYSLVEQMIDPKAVLYTREGEKEGRETVLAHLREMAKQPNRKQIVAPKGGRITVLVSSLSAMGTLEGRPREQVYHIRQDHLVGLVDLGRTPDMVYRPESQPN